MTDFPTQWQLTRFQAREYEKGIIDVLTHARRLVNSFSITVRVPPEVLGMVCSFLTTEDVFSASQVCHHWRTVLVSFPLLWTQFPCRHILRTIISLERCKSLPIQLQFYRNSPIEAMEEVLLHGNKIISLSLHHHPARTPLLGQLFTFSGPSVERLYMGPEDVAGWARTQTAHGIWQDLPSLRELFVHKYSIPMNRLAASNLVHLALEQAGYGQDVTVQCILDMLRGCPLLETLLVTESRVRANITPNYPPVPLPRLRSIELGEDEVRSGLATHLQFPQNVAVGLRMLFPSEVCGKIPFTVEATMQHVLRRIDICYIALAESQDPQGALVLLVRFEGLYGSLEITTVTLYDDGLIWAVLFSPGGVLFSHSPRIENVRELHIVGCHLGGDRMFHHIHAAMPNITSISFFDCKEPHAFGLLLQTHHSLPPFPRLERVMVLGPELGLIGMAKARRGCGLPLKTVVVGRGSGRFEYDHLDDYTELGELVDNLHTKCLTEILQWGIGNEVLNVWSTADTPGPVSPNEKLAVPG